MTTVTNAPGPWAEIWDRTFKPLGGARVSGHTVLPNLLLNVPALARRSEAEVARLLGPPDGVVLPARAGSVKRSYRGGMIEVVFTAGEARWIKLHTQPALPFSKDALRSLGLPPRRPTYDNSPHVLSWHNIARLKEVSLYGGGAGRGATSVLICVETSAGLSAHPAPRRHRSLPGIRALFFA